ncbi:hypothetical protein HK100_004374 [Physocladia obscura]|uniref:Uncharacterized protein n=1 Tax=Physocladia obscura TaxID=109957 RepID=A0AAD5XJK0_9FUNG|nr:hypothetical protein HK100_004374 [Physocladia obscura]
MNETPKLRATTTMPVATAGTAPSVSVLSTTLNNANAALKNSNMNDGAAELGGLSISHRLQPLSVSVLASRTADPNTEIRTSKIAPSILIFSGGSAVSPFVPMLQSISEDICYAMPVSDDGGSTFEIVKVMGGPGIGDIRSRLLGLADTSTPEGLAVFRLLSYRLPVGNATSSNSIDPAKLEWMNILEGNHALWTDIPLPHQYTIRSFLFQFNDKLLKGTAGIHMFSNGEMNQTFDFRGGCIGNFFITGCRLFFNSLEAAIFQFSKLVGCPNKTAVLPIISTNHSPVSIGVTLRNGVNIFGQCEISHPGATAIPIVSPQSSSNLRGVHTRIPSSPSFHDTSPASSLGGNISMNQSTTPYRLKRPPSSSFKKFNLGSSLDYATNLNIHPSKSHTSLSSSQSSSNLFFSKSHTEAPPLTSTIRRVFYTTPTHTEISPTINHLLPSLIARKRTVIYGMGSLYTSLHPCLIVPGVGSLLADTPQTKILLVNGTHDRESAGYTALDFVLGVVDALNCSVITERAGDNAVREVVTRRDASTDMDGADTVWRWRGALVGTGSGGGGGGNGGSGGMLQLGGSGGGTSSCASSSVGVSPDGGVLFGSSLKMGVTIGTKAGVLDFSDNEDDDDTTSQGDAESEELEMSEMMSPGGRGYLVKPYPPSAFITHMLYTEDSKVVIEVEQIEALGIKCMMVAKNGDNANSLSIPPANFLGFGSHRVQRGSYANFSSLNSRVPGHFGVEELKNALEPLLR